MEFASWSLVVGGLLVLMGLSGSALRRLPVSTTMLYVAAGVLIGPLGLGLVAPDAIIDAGVLERLAEVAVLVSLFTSGLKLSPALSDRRWRLPLRLAFGSMAVTVAGIAALAMVLFSLPLGAAVLLGAVLAPTDPVLASDVQLEHPADRDRLRFALTGEAGLNDGTAFPFVMLGLGLLGLHELGTFGWRWLAVDVVWAVAAGLAIGAALGTLVGRLVLHLRRTYREAVGLDDLLGLGLIALSYGAALHAYAYGFLAVFAAGVAMRRVGRLNGASESTPQSLAAPGATESPSAAEVATHPESAPTFLMQALLGFNEQIEHLAEVAMALAIGALLWSLTLPEGVAPLQVALFIGVLFCVIRPISVALGLAASRTSTPQRRLIAWFGIRGIGSIYYLMYAIGHGLEAPVADLLVAITLSAVVASVVLHGVSVTPLMRRYARTRKGANPVES